jgi:hypothetical protein
VSTGRALDPAQNGLPVRLQRSSGVKNQRHSEFPQTVVHFIRQENQNVPISILYSAGEKVIAQLDLLPLEERLTLIPITRSSFPLMAFIKSTLFLN